MRRALLLALLLTVPPAPWALAGARAATPLTLEAPEAAASGLPFVVRACVGAPADVRVVLRAPDASPTGRYAPWDAGCRDVTLQPDDVEGALVVDARVRDGASVTRVVTLARPDLPERALRIVAVYAPPFSGALLENAGERAAELGGLTLARSTLANATLAPGERVFVGAASSAPPDAGAARALPATLLALKGNVTLARAKLTLDSFVVPALERGEVAAARGGAGARRAGVTNVTAAPMLVAGRMSAYATPDAGAAPVVALVDEAEREVLVEAYTLTSVEVAAALARALDRGASVTLLLEGAPVGGVPPEERGILAALEARGAAVRVLQGDASFPTRYRTLHAKTIVVDREAVLVATENLRATSYPAEAGPDGTRGYGLIVRNASLARVFAGVFDADAAVGWPDVRSASDIVAAVPPSDLAAWRLVAGPMFEAEGAWNVTPVLAPEGSWALLDLLNASRERVDAEQLFAEATRAPFVDALVGAARRGVAVRLLLDGRNDDGRNAATAQMLNALAARERLALEARVDEAPRTLHAKLVLVDGRAAYVGSMNWGLASATQNREAGLIVENAALASWLGGWVEKDLGGEGSGERKEEGKSPRGEEAPRAVPGAPTMLALVVAVVASALRARPWASAAWARSRART